LEDKGKHTTVPYRFFSTYIFREKDEVSCQAISIGNRKVAVGVDVLKDLASLQGLACYWRSKLELEDRARDDYDELFQTFIYVDGKRIPVDHICAEINGVSVRLDFTGGGMYVKSSNHRRRWTYTRSHYKSLRLFASAIRQAALARR
jgi:hypothetical protein